MSNNSIINRILTFFRLNTSASRDESLKDVIDEGDAVGDSPDAEKETMLRNVLNFNELSVEDVMIPRADIIAIDYNTSFDDMKKIILENVHTRIPIYRQTLDDIAGFIHVKDLVTVLFENKPFLLDKILRQALFVPPSMKISTLLLKMQLSRVHIALVVDEYGGTCGLITMEDMMEEIVGEIEDEHDVSEDAHLMQLGDNLFEASARVAIEEIEEKFTVELVDEEEDFDTLGGLIFFMLGRVPAKGEIASHPCGLEFEITDADPRRIKRVLIRKKV